MKRCALLTLIFTLILSCAAPTGAVFAFDEAGEHEITEPIQENPELNDPTKQDEQVLQAQDTAAPAATFSPAEPSSLELPAVTQNGSKREGVSQEVISDPVVESTAALSPYPPVVISELQVDGVCSGGTWCAPAGGNVEFIELYNPTANAISLEGWKLRRQATGTTSQPAEYVTFGKTGIFAGEYALVASGLVASDTVPVIAPLPSNLSNSAGSLLLVAPDGTVIDMVGWGSSAKSFYTSPAKAPGTNQSIQRCMKNGALQEANPRDNSVELLVYEDIGPTPGLGISCVEPPVVNLCTGIVISEIAANVDEQFIELHNPTSGPIVLDGCRVLTNRSTTKAFIFPADTRIDSNDFMTVPIIATDLALTKTTSGTVYVVSSDGLNEVASMSYKDLPAGTSWALIDGSWKQTYRVTPGKANVYEQYPACETGYSRNLETGRCNKVVESAVLQSDCGEGRERNPDTGRCRNIPTPKELAPCGEGQYRNEETNRCRSLAATVASVLKPCADDQFRNPLTNRCKSIASADDVALTDCSEGRERNPETNRCRNILLSTPPEAAFAVEPTKEAANAFTGWWVLGLVVAAGTGYGIWEWRDEIGRALRRLPGTHRP